MFHTLYSGHSGSEFQILKSWLNILVKSRPNLNADNRFDADMTETVMRFQSENYSPDADRRD